MNTIHYKPKAIRQLRKINDRESIRTAIKDLENMPNCNNVIRLTNHQYNYRLRVGRFRVFFEFDGVLKIISIEEVKKRNERTY